MGGGSKGHQPVLVTSAAIVPLDRAVVPLASGSTACPSGSAAGEVFTSEPELRAIVPLDRAVVPLDSGSTAAVPLELPPCATEGCFQRYLQR